MSADLIVTVVVVVVAAVWAGRRIWRALHRHERGGNEGAGCGAQPGACSGCPAARPTQLDTSTCDTDVPEES